MVDLRDHCDPFAFCSLTCKVNKRLRTIRNRTVKQRAGMLGLSAVVNAYPYRVPCFVPEILVDVVRTVEVFDGGTVGDC